MKLALLADLHANREAVAAVLAHAQERSVERHVFLGDFVGYGADPGWVVDILREHVTRGAVAVMGNHDAAVVRGALPSMVPDARLVVGWTREQLTEAQLAFLGALPMSVTEGETLFVHANAWAPSEWDYIVSRADAVRSLQATNCRFTFCGHTHVPALYHLTSTGKSGDFAPAHGVTIPLSPLRRWLGIPGSTGQPRDGNPAACYAIFDTTAQAITYYRVPYDHHSAAAKVRAAGLPAQLAERLTDGD